MKQGLHDLCRLLPGADANKLLCSRSARHSKFPECVECHDRRARWHSAACKAGSDPAEVARLAAEVLEHNKEWQGDRQVALSIRRSLYQKETSTGIYENGTHIVYAWVVCSRLKTGCVCFFA